MTHNVNESLREQEIFNPEAKGANENTSYSSKIKNAISLNDVYVLIEKLKLEVFRGDEDAEKDFQDQKYSAEGGTFMDQRRKQNK